MTKCLFILAAALAMAVGCKGGGAADGDTDASVPDIITDDNTDTNDVVGEGGPDSDCLHCVSYSIALELSGTVKEGNGDPVEGIKVLLAGISCPTIPDFFAISDQTGAWHIAEDFSACGCTLYEWPGTILYLSDTDGAANGLWPATAFDVATWDVSEWVHKPPCANYDVTLKRIGVQILMPEQPDDDALLASDAD